jgi:hypothetical protein
MTEIGMLRVDKSQHDAHSFAQCEHIHRIPQRMAP